jgi:uncharacterized protein (DUF1778 family)
MPISDDASLDVSSVGATEDLDDAVDGTPRGRAARTSRDTRLSFRASSKQVALLRRAAEASHKSVTEFVLESSALAAEHILADRRWFRLDDQEWLAFEAALDRPPVFKPRLNESLNEPGPFSD